MIREFLARKGATVCAPTASHKDNAASLRTMRRREEEGACAFRGHAETAHSVVEGVMCGNVRGAVRVNDMGEPC